MSTCAILFARYPEPGQVKTRLCPWLSADTAATLYEAFLHDAFGLLRTSTAGRKVIAFSPAGRAREMAALVDDPALDLVPQGEGDLGARMRAALDEAHARGARRAVIIGSDCPTLAPDVIDRALAALGGRDVVLGPATDGGYYLVGCSGRAPARLFEDVEWGSAGVLAATLERLDGASLALLDPWRDVDEREDVEWLVTQLRALALAGDPRAPRTREALESLLADKSAVGDRNGH